MKRVAIATGLHEEYIRPPSLMNEFMRLSLIDAHVYFGDPEKLTEAPCPACGADKREGAFRKDGFLYCSCGVCGSLYVSPRPTEAALADYYAHSSASHYRVERLARDTGRARQSHLLSSHAMWLGRIVDEFGIPQVRRYADVHTQSVLVFEEILRLKLFDALYSLDPPESLVDECAQMGVEVTRGALDNLGAATSFGQLENCFSPLAYLEKLAAMLAPGGVITFTTRAVTGFDMLVLWDKTPYIFVPEHLNLMSLEGLEMLVDRAGLEMVELSTPGQLDVEFVQHAAAADPSVAIPRQLRYLLDKRNEEALADFQQFLQKHRLSSHVRAAARKKRSA